MTVTSDAEHLLMASGGDRITRGFVVGTRAILFQAVVTAIAQDAVSNGMYQLTLGSISGSGGVGNTLPGMTLDVGTTAGARDVGMVRLRGAGVVPDSTIPIAETAPGDVPIQIGHFVTARLEWLPWRIPKRIVETFALDGTISAITEYLDYDLGYPGGSNAFPPKANIVAGTNADGSWKAVKPFGWLDDGQDYRTIVLSNLASVCLNPGSTPGGQLWNVQDGTVVSGSITDDTLTVQFPVGFRYLYLFYEDSNGAGDFRVFPLWVDDPANPQFVLRNFDVTSDEQEADRVMQLEFFGDANDADEALIPTRSLVCYFEEPRWAGGSTPPESYVDQCLGWITDDKPVLKRSDSRYGLSFGGAATWMQKFRTTSITLINTGMTPTTYSEMEHMTVDRVLDFSLRAYTTLRMLINVFYTGVTVEADQITLPLGDAWSQLVQTAPKALMSVPACDSLSTLWLVRHLSYLSDSLRSTRNTALATSGADWKDTDGLTLQTSQTQQVGVVNANGDLWNNGDRILYGSIAPGRRDGSGTQTTKLPDQFLGLPIPQRTLDQLVGDEYAHANNPRPNVPLTLFGNEDVVEIAWNAPISITWTADTVRGTVLDAALFLVKHISRTHDQTQANEPKQITLTLEQVTNGPLGEAQPVLQNEGVTQIPDGETGPVLGAVGSGTQIMVSPNTDNGLYITHDYDTHPAFGGPSWIRYAVAVSGNILDGVQDAFTLTRIVLVTDDTNAIYTVDDPLGARTLTLIKTLRAAIADPLAQWRQIDASFGADYIVVTSFYGDSSGNEGTWETHSLDGGLTWSTETQLTANFGVLSGGGNFPGLFVSSRTPGEADIGVYTASAGTASTAELYHLSSNFASVAPTGISTDNINPSTIHRSWADNEATLYYGAADLSQITANRNRLFRKDGGGAPVDITPVIGGNKQRPFYSRGVHTCPADASTVLMAVAGSTTSGVLMSRDKGDTQILLSAGSSTPFHAAEVSGDNADVGFVYGDATQGFVNLAARTIEDRSGNIPTDYPSAGRFVRIMGYPS